MSALGAPIADASPSTQRQGRRRSLFLFAAAFLIVLALRPVPVLRMQPGPAYPVKFDTAPENVDDTEGRWRFTTVSVTEMNGLEWMIAKVTGKSGDLIPNQGGDLSERQASDALAMRNSKRVAWAVANQVLGTGVTGEPNGALITAVASDSPAADAAVPVGGRITAVDDTEVQTASAVAAAVNASDGDSITLEVVYDREPPRRIPVTPTRSGDAWRIGVEVTDSAETTDPAHDIDSTGVGGPSAGLMFTLAYIDALSPGDLTAGLEIAGSGTISTTGAVGPVGGTDHKVRGAAREGATVFFASAAAPPTPTRGVRVVPVHTVDEAIGWLCENGATDAVCLRGMRR